MITAPSILTHHMYICMNVCMYCIYCKKQLWSLHFFLPRYDSEMEVVTPRTRNESGHTLRLPHSNLRYENLTDLVFLL